MGPIASSGAESQAVNLGLGGLLCLIQLYQLFILPIGLLPENGLWGLTVLPLLFATTSYWALLHEAFHRLLHPNPAVNDRVGRTMAILFGAPYRVLRIGHLTHHRLNGMACDRPEAFDPTRRSRGAAAALFYPRLLFGLYLAELFSSLQAFLPRALAERLVRRIFYDGDPQARGTADMAVRRIVGSGGLSEVRADSAAIIAVYGSAFYCYGENWPWLIAVILGRGVAISVMDNAFHYGAPLGDSRQAYNLRLPDLASRLILNFNLHRIHHCHPNLSWRALPAMLDARSDGYDENLSKALLRQFRGPIPLDRLKDEYPQASR
ncbi:fatty acid desaturase [Rhodospirillaceae bacterium SYSU D60014]|uniref:fatty acid desaturase family protein n=1 Tax=Virgifigura deserti TaxID=2268457 RepID=UPI000E660985